MTGYVVFRWADGALDVTGWGFAALAWLGAIWMVGRG